MVMLPPQPSLPTSVPMSCLPPIPFPFAFLFICGNSSERGELPPRDGPCVELSTDGQRIKGRFQHREVSISVAPTSHSPVEFSIISFLISCRLSQYYSSCVLLHFSAPHRYPVSTLLQLSWTLLLALLSS